jgi:hypothetical protein
MPVSQQTHADVSAPTISQIGVHPPTYVFLQNEPKFSPAQPQLSVLFSADYKLLAASSYLAKRTDFSPVRYVARAFLNLLCEHSYPATEPDETIRATCETNPFGLVHICSEGHLFNHLARNRRAAGARQTKPFPGPGTS